MARRGGARGYGNGEGEGVENLDDYAREDHEDLYGSERAFGEGDEDGVDRRDGESDGEDEEATGPQPRTMREKKKAALYPPIASVCLALGGFEEFRTEDGEIETAYSLGDQVVSCLKDLKRYWKMDEVDDDRTVARIFYEVGVLKGDLIPILLSTLGTGAKGDRIALACVELIGAMTWPINVIEELRDAKAQDELTREMDYTSLVSAQLTYKLSILRSGALRAMFQLMMPGLAKTAKERSQKDEAVISLVLHTFRNLAALKDPVTTSESADAVEMSNLQSDYIEQLAEENIFDLLIAIAANSESAEYATWNLITLDVLHLIFRGVRPAELMVSPNQVDENRLKDLLDLEGSKKRTAAKHGNTRHSRFGTTIALRTGGANGEGRNYIVHKQSSLALGVEKTMDSIKKSTTKKARVDDDLQPPSHLRPDAIRCLHKVAVSFIDTAFNPFFASVLKDIRMERLKVKESDTVRFLFLSRFFLEFFLLLYRDEQARGVSPFSDEGHDFDLIAEMTETHSIGFVTQRMKTAMEEKPVPWIELHAAIDLFTQMLLIIDALALSGIEDNVDVAEVLQNKLYYENETLDMILAVVQKYDKQSLKYLDSIINLAYVMLRMLEKYSKSKAYMYVRKKRTRRANKKKGKKTAEDDEGDGIGFGGDEEADEVDRGALTYSEHTFKFEEFEAKFADEGTLGTCMIYLEGYRDFKDPEQMKRVVSLMHRQAIKAKSEGLFYKPTVLELFRRILEDHSISSARDGPAADLRKLVEYVLKKFFKSVKENPLMLVDIFLPKTRSQLGKMRAGVEDPYASSDDDGPTTINAALIREVEVQPGFSLTQQIGIAIACLVDEDDLPLVELVKEQLALVSAARTEVVLSTDGDATRLADEDDDSDEAIRRKAARLLGPSKEAIALFAPQVVAWDSEAQRKAGWSNAHFKLLMRLLEWESSEVPESQELVWLIPPTIAPSKLDGDIRIIDGYLLDPVDPDGKTAADYLRKKRKAPVRRRRRVFDEDDDDPDAEPKKRQRKRKEEAAQAFKSAQFIEDSDDEDDEERDRLFFEREQQLREKLNAGAITASLATGVKKKKEKAAAAASSKTATKRKSDASEANPVPKRRKGHGPQHLVGINAELVTSLSDDEAADDAAMRDSGSESESSETLRESSVDPARASATSSASQRVMSLTSASSVGRAGAGDGDEEEEEDVGGGARSIQKSKRRIVLDSDDE